VYIKRIKFVKETVIMFEKFTEGAVRVITNIFIIII